MAATRQPKRMITANDKTKTIADWALIIGMSASCLHQQINKYGESVVEFYINRNPGEKIGKIDQGKISPKNNPTVIFRALQRGAFVDPVCFFRMDLIGFNKYLSGTMSK